MKKTEYSSVTELETLFEEYWVPYSIKEIGVCECGTIIKSILDEKSNMLYLERYNTIKESYELFSFESGDHPIKWRLEDDGVSEVNL